jgi:hypothetical protein
VDRPDGVGGQLELIGVELGIALVGAPAEVQPLAGIDAVGRRRDVDLLDRALADVGDLQVAGLGSNEKRHGLRRAERPDLGAGAVDPDERVVGGHP